MTDAHQPPPLTVLYDGACPLCRREIDVYRGLRPNTPVCFADVSDPASQLPSGTTREQLLSRFHVRGRDGQLLSGAQAFLALWTALPSWRWLALVCRLPVPPGRWSACIASFSLAAGVAALGVPAGPARSAPLISPTSPLEHTP